MERQLRMGGFHLDRPAMQIPSSGNERVHLSGVNFADTELQAHPLAPPPGLMTVPHQVPPFVMQHTNLNTHFESGNRFGELQKADTRPYIFDAAHGRYYKATGERVY